MRPSQNQAALNSSAHLPKIKLGQIRGHGTYRYGRSYRSRALRSGRPFSVAGPTARSGRIGGSIADAGSAYNEGNPPATLPYGDGTVANPAQHRAPGSMLGLEQRAWLLETIKDVSRSLEALGQRHAPATYAAGHVYPPLCRLSR